MLTTEEQINLLMTIETSAAPALPTKLVLEAI